MNMKPSMLVFSVAAVFMVNVSVTLAATTQAQVRAAEARAKAAQAREHAAEAQVKAEKQKEDALKRSEEEQKAKAAEIKAESHVGQDVKKDSMTTDEVNKLTQDRKDIESLELKLSAAEKIGTADARQAQKLLDTVSYDIWTEQHVGKGKPVEVYRFGKYIKFKSDITGTFADPNSNLASADACKILDSFKAIIDLKQKLNGQLSKDDRGKIQKQYNDLLRQYFTSAQ